MWTIAKVRNGFADLPNERFHTFAIKLEGEVVGELQFYRGRWKSAGGPAWKGIKFKNSCCYFSKKKEDVLHWFKTDEVR